MVGYSQMVSTIFTTSSPLLHQFFVGSLPLLRWFFTVIFFPFQSTPICIYTTTTTTTHAELHTVSYSGVFKSNRVYVYTFMYFFCL